MASPNPMDSLRRMLGMRSPANLTDMSGQSTTALDETVDPRLKSFEPSEQDLIDQQEGRIAAQGAQNRGHSTGVIVEPSRDALKDSAMGKVKSLLGMTDIKHKNDMEEAALKEQGLNKRAQMAHQEAGRPYFTQVQLADGPHQYDTRTGQVGPRLGDYRPSGGESTALTQAMSLQRDFGRIQHLFNPDVIGPLAGRWQQFEQAYLGGDPTAIELRQTTDRIALGITYMLSGKQINESEAARLRQILPQMNEPPTTYATKLANSMREFNQMVQDKARFAFGQMSPGDVNSLTGRGGVPPAGAPPSTPAPAQGPTAPPTAPTGAVKKYNPATKRAE